MDFDVLRIKITQFERGNDLVIKEERSYDFPVITFFNASCIGGIMNAKENEILCVEFLGKGFYKIRYRDAKCDTILTAEQYAREINN